MAPLKETVSIGAPPKLVFGYLADMARVPEWMPNIVEAERTSEIESGEGAELRVVVNAAGRESSGTSRCVEADAPHRLVIESSLDMGLTSTITFDLAADGRRTDLSATVAYAIAGRGFGRLMGNLFGDKLARRDIATALASLKERLEEQQAKKPSRRRTTST